MKASSQWFPPGRRPRGNGLRAFSLIELLIGIGIATLLAALIVPSVQGSLRKAQSVQCLAKMRAIGQGFLLVTQDTGEYPRSMHSAAGAGTQPWARAILPYLDLPADPSETEWTALFERVLRCPCDKKNTVTFFSYALNVFFELTPDGDDYAGSPQTWRRPGNVPWATRTILLAEPKPVPYADHLMCHQWSGTKGAGNAVDARRHGDKSNYLFADGHGEALPLAATFDPAKGVNLWNPALAGAAAR